MLLRSPPARHQLSVTIKARTRHSRYHTLQVKPDSDSESSSSSTTSVLETFTDDEDAPAGIVGAEFFGGSKQKQEFYDPEAEANAGAEFFTKKSISEQQRGRTYDRFQDIHAFDSSFTQTIARDLQNSINSILVANKKERKTSSRVTYAPNMQWISPLKVEARVGMTKTPSSSGPTPWKALEDAQDFYRNLAVAITGGRQIDDNKLELYWEAAFTWPIFWAPRVLLCLRSELTLLSGRDNHQEIVRQVDIVLNTGSNNNNTNNQDITSVIASQILPRFWDFYHIGMTPSTELSPRAVASTSPLSSYKVYDLPPRLHFQPSLLDLTGSREDANAATLPNHAFTCAIKTMGPQKQDYTPTSPVQVQILTESNVKTENVTSNKGGKPGKMLRLQWRIPVAVETLMQQALLPGADGSIIDDETIPPEAMPQCQYVWQGPRRVATVPYGGGPQDAVIATLREQLYTQVIKDGWKPRLDAANGNRPQFFFWQNSVKACYTDEGLGMAVYEWRPRFTKSNEVGIELEL